MRLDRWRVCTAEIMLVSGKSTHKKQGIWLLSLREEGGDRHSKEAKIKKNETGGSLRFASLWSNHQALEREHVFQQCTWKEEQTELKI